MKASPSHDSSVDSNTLHSDDVGDNVHPSVPVDPSVEFNQETDVFVLGFQELDLSTEALIYSTGTVREDAWCSAVFAALGEKGERYEKVIIFLTFFRRNFGASIWDRDRRTNSIFS